jgi:pSer/pThr/pTyr-binding forkhead associated (FHA) protein
VLLAIVLAVVITTVIRISRKRREQSDVVTPPVVETPPWTHRAEAATLTEAERTVELTVVAGHELGRSNKIRLSGKATIGREAVCDVSYPSDPEMSGKHCELIQAGAYVEVSDLGSTNGTLLNGAKLVTRQRLEDGDLIRAGRTEVRINFGTRK